MLQHYQETPIDDQSSASEPAYLSLEEIRLLPSTPKSISDYSISDEEKLSGIEKAKLRKDVTVSVSFNTYYIRYRSLDIPMIISKEEHKLVDDQSEGYEPESLNTQIAGKVHVIQSDVSEFSVSDEEKLGVVDTRDVIDIDDKDSDASVSSEEDLVELKQIGQVNEERIEQSDASISSEEALDELKQIGVFDKEDVFEESDGSISSEEALVELKRIGQIDVLGTEGKLDQSDI